MREEGCEAAGARPRHHCYCRMGEKNPPQAHNPRARGIHDPILSFLQPNPIFKSWGLVFPCKILTGQTCYSNPKGSPLWSCDLAPEASSPSQKKPSLLLAEWGNLGYGFRNGQIHHRCLQPLLSWGHYLVPSCWLENGNVFKSSCRAGKAAGRERSWFELLLPSPEPRSSISTSPLPDSYSAIV